VNIDAVRAEEVMRSPEFRELSAADVRRVVRLATGSERQAADAMSERLAEQQRAGLPMG